MGFFDLFKKRPNSSNSNNSSSKPSVAKPKKNARPGKFTPYQECLAHALNSFCIGYSEEEVKQQMIDRGVVEPELSKLITHASGMTKKFSLAPTAEKKAENMAKIKAEAKKKNES